MKSIRITKTYPLFARPAVQQLVQQTAPSRCRLFSDNCSSKFSVERIGQQANLYRLTPQLNPPIETMSSPHTPPYSENEINIQHAALIKEADHICQKAAANQFIGLHGTANIYKEALIQKIEYQRDDTCLQLGEGFYVAVGKHAEMIAYIFGSETASNVNRKSHTAQHEAQSTLKQQKKVKGTSLEIKADAFVSMKGLILPSAFYWDNAIESDNPTKRVWMEDENKREFIENYDYIISMLEIPRNHTPNNEFIQIKFNPRALHQLQGVE